MLEFWNESMLEFWNESMLEFWNESMLEFWNESMLEFWNESMLEFWNEIYSILFELIDLLEEVVHIIQNIPKQLINFLTHSCLASNKGPGANSVDRNLMP